MKSLTILAIIFLLTISCQKSDPKVQKKAIGLKSEKVVPSILNPTEIAEKYKPKNSKIVHKVIETDFWKVKNVIIAFYETSYVEEDEYKSDRQFVECYLLIPQGNNKYQKILVTKFQDDNVDTEIQSVFFANADKDKDKELIIISTCTHRLQYLYEGTEYMTSVFDKIDLSKIGQKKQLTELYDISNLLRGGFTGFTEDNPNSTASFTDAVEVKKELKRLGY